MADDDDDAPLSMPRIADVVDVGPALGDGEVLLFGCGVGEEKSLRTVGFFSVWSVFLLRQLRVPTIAPD